MILTIILTAMICGTIGFIVLLVTSGGRNISARARDRGLARLYEARASLMHVEELERRAVLFQQDEEAKLIREARERRRRDEMCEESR